MKKDEAYDFLCKVAEGISLMFGPNCETIIHEMNGQRIKNLAVYNGHVTGRKAGSTTSIFGKDTALEEETQQDLDLTIKIRWYSRHRVDRSNPPPITSAEKIITMP